MASGSKKRSADDIFKLQLVKLADLDASGEDDGELEQNEAVQEDDCL